MKAHKCQILAISIHGKKNILKHFKNSYIEYGTLDLKLPSTMNYSRRQSNCMGKPIKVEIKLHWERCDNKRKLNMDWLITKTIGKM